MAKLQGLFAASQADATGAAEVGGAGAATAAADKPGPAGALPAVTVYTDGSCDTGSGDGGWAYLLVDDGGHSSESGYVGGTTNNRMELIAAVNGLTALQRPSRVKIVTDSQYLKKAFTDGWLERWQSNGWRTASRQPVKNRDLWEQLLALEQNHEVSWNWTRGHSGHPENEEVDRLALAARRSGSNRVRGANRRRR